MRWYAVPSWRLARQIGADALMLVWAIGWFGAGRATNAAIRALADPTRRGAGLVDQVRAELDVIAERAGGIPLVGGELRGPIDDLAGTVATLAAQAEGQAAAFETLATQAGWLVFVLPVLVALAVWVPFRVRFVLRTRATTAAAALPYGSDLLALRALATQPLDRLTGVADDPVASWRAGDPAVVKRLARLELVRAGLVRPPAGGPPSQ